ncbi:protease Do-like 2, chloroplastic isoform X2 [Rhododendron vialii]|uniref:protease Do-like 2, chloroplastic isoform X2 n=1 Tax=Rhododendron vialii TaxID=182163 RepID=UPI00265DF07D|nr:protease Do-like 2, chloroplastic isoform X2 [Rhododendron vialii]
MAAAAVACWFSAITSTGTSRYSLSSSQRLFSTPHTPNHRLFVTKASNDKKKSPRKSAKEKKSTGKSKDERPCANADGNSVRSNAGQPHSTAFKSFGAQIKDAKGFLVNDQQVETGNFQDATCLNAVVKVYCTHTEPDYSLPWQKQRQYTSTGSAFIIGDGKLLTNAHCIEYGTQVKVKRRGDDTKYVAKVLARGVECDIALLSVESEEFWKGAESLQLGHLPRLQDAVTVVGYPLGGDTISVTKGVVSRIEVTSYAHGSSELLGIQIDAAINPGNSGGPAFNDQGECIGVAFQVYRSDDAENIGYVIPTTVVSHFLEDYKKNGKYSGFPCLGVLLQKLENPALRACLKVLSNEGVLVRRVEPTSDAINVLKEGDVIVSFDGVNVGCEGTVPFRSTERIAFRYLISQRFAGDVAELGIIRGGALMKVQAVLNPRVHLVPYHIEGGQPSYFIVAGLVFTPLSDLLIEEASEESLGLKLLAKARYSLATFKGEQIVILSQVLADEVNIGYESMEYMQVLKFNGTRIKNIHHLAHLVDSFKGKYLVFEFEDNYISVLERKASAAALSDILTANSISSERSPDLLEPYVDPTGNNQAYDHQGYGDSPVSNSELGFDALIWT